MHSTACGVGASSTNLASLPTISSNSNSAAPATKAVVIEMVHLHKDDDATNPLNSANGMDDEERNAGRSKDVVTTDVEQSEERKVRSWIKKLTYGAICFFGIGLLGYVAISLSFSDWSKSTSHRSHRVTVPTQDLPKITPDLLESTTTTTTTTVEATAVAAAAVNRLSGVFHEAAVCSDTQTCSDIGRHILLGNGSAVDAAIATMLCNGLMKMEHMGIGGGFLMNIYDSVQKQSYQLDASPVASNAIDTKLFDSDSNRFMVGAHSIAVPGELMGYHVAHQRYGKLPWKDLVEPSLKLCKSGFVMARDQHIFLLGDRPYPDINNESELASPTKLCKTYQLLSDNGPMDFYNGTVAKLLAKDLKELGSIITRDDLDAYKAEMRLSVTMPLGKDTLYAVPPVSSGSVVSHILAIIEGFNLTRADLADDESYALTIHRITEATKLGLGHRAELGDPRFSDLRELVSLLTSPAYAAQQRARINDSYVLGSAADYGTEFSNVDNPDGTSSLAVLAPNGDAVSVISSINGFFGSKLSGPRTGVIFNNFMEKFTARNNYTDAANSVAAHKRPMNMESPLLLADGSGNIRLILAAAGTSNAVQVATRLLWLENTLDEAIDRPRVYPLRLSELLEYDDGSFSAEVLQLLQQRGHKLLPELESSFSVCGIVRQADAIYSNADRRRGGGVAGF